jgi:hypothetical protein
MIKQRIFGIICVIISYFILNFAWFFFTWLSTVLQNTYGLSCFLGGLLTAFIGVMLLVYGVVHIVEP